jgi:outer membrane protein assembly factor BamB
MKRNIRWRRVLLGPIEAPPLVEDDVVFVGGRDQRVYALGADGQVRWVRPLGIFADVAAQPLRAGSRVVVGDRTGGVTALDAARGEVLWRARLKSAARPLAARGGGDVVAVADEEGSVVGLDGASGKERWRVRAPGGLAAAPVFAEMDGSIVVPCRDSMLLIVDAATGAEKARVPTQARPTAPPAISGGGFVVAIEGDEVHSISREGKIAWRARMPGAIAGAPLVADGAAFVGAGSSLVALDLANGQERFPKKSYGARIRASPAISGDTLYVATGDGALHAIGARTGAHRWTYRTQGEIIAEPIPKGDTVFLASTDFGIYAIRD